MSDAAPPDCTPGTAALPSPAALRAALPVSEGARAHTKEVRRALRDVLHGRDRRRLVAIVGPCSLHDAEAALAYAARLGALAASLSDALVVVMRTYVEKPRTALGWKGLVNDPHLDDSCDVATGLERARRVLRDVGEGGVACGAELLDPLVAPYLEDLLAWGCIGARTVESPVHRQLASGLAIPVGMKNTTDGSLDGALHALVAAAGTHAALGVDDDGRVCVRRTAGNPDTHLVLRGGRAGPNHHEASVAEALARARSLGLARPVVVDCSHENSGRDHRRQGAVCRAVLAQVAAGERGIAGVMLESQLEPGRQPLEPGRPPHPHRSVTDACIGWEETEALLREAAAVVRAGPPFARGTGAARPASPPNAREAPSGTPSGA